MKSRNRVQLSIVALGALSSAACGEPMKKAQQIEEPRTLAVQVETEDGSATPLPGEDAAVRVLFAGPEGPEEVSLAYKICESADSARGIPFCDGPVYAEGTLDAVDSVAEIAFSVPSGAEAGQHLAILGVACANGEPELADDPDDWSCSTLEAPLSFSFDAYVGGDETNDNPDFSDIEIEVDGQPVVLTAPDEAPSCEDGVPVVEAKKKVMVSIDYGSSSRQEDEWLQVSHFATSGEYERQYTILEPSEELFTELEWEAGKAGASKHYLVARDGVGGVSFVTFSVCAE